MELNESDDDVNVSFGEEDLSLLSVFNETVVSINQSFESDLGDGPLTSTPRRRKERNGSKNNHGLFKVPTAPSAFGSCSICKRSLKTEKGYKNHMVAHKWKEAALRRPSAVAVIDHCSREMGNITKALVKELESVHSQCTSKMSQEVIIGINDLSRQVDEPGWISFAHSLCIILEQVLEDPKAQTVMPSALRAKFQMALSASFSSQEFRENALSALLDLSPLPDNVAWCIIFSICKKLVDCAILHISTTMRGNALSQASSTRCKGDSTHCMSIQMITYAAGSALRYHLRMVRSHPRSRRLQAIKECVLSKFATIGGPSITDKKDPNYWTHLMSRESLLHIRQEALPFFLEVSKVLQSEDRPTTTPLHDKVMEQITSSNSIISLWDAIVDTSLDDEASFFLMVKLIRSLTNTYGKGTMLKNMNSEWRKSKGKKSKSTISVSHRAQLL